MLCTHDDTYKTAVNHYLSPERQDNVKTKWERPFSQDLTKALVSKILLNSQQKPVSIIDLGCGIGEGVERGRCVRPDTRTVASSFWAPCKAPHKIYRRYLALSLSLFIYSDI